ncbi:integrase [Escherichia coli]|nr:integrase [Escherichia coli]
MKTFPHPSSQSERPLVSCPGFVACRKRLHTSHLLTGVHDSRRGPLGKRIYGHSRFCNTDFDDKLACLNLSSV